MEIRGDENVSKVEASADNVSVAYKQRAWLFGVVPVMVKALATVRADGSVDVQYPWYAFLMITNEADLEAQVASRVGALVSLGSDAEAEAVVGFTASAQAQIVDEVRSVMESQLAADLNAEAAVDAAVGANIE